MQELDRKDKVEEKETWTREDAAILSAQFAIWSQVCLLWEKSGKPVQAEGNA